MTYEDMLFKMVPMHSEMFRRMLGVNEVPEPVCVRYFQIKKVIDKVSAPMSIMDLLRIAMDCGFDLETGKFGCKKMIVVSKIPTDAERESLALSQDGETIAIEQASEVKEFIDKEMDKIETAIDDEDKKKQVVGEDSGVDQNAETTVAEPEHEDGDAVTVYIDGDAKQGVIKGFAKTPGGINYEVVVDGETVEISEDDIE